MTNSLLIKKVGVPLAPDPLAKKEVLRGGISFKYLFFGNIEINSILQSSTVILIFPFELKLFKLPLLPVNSILPFS